MNTFLPLPSFAVSARCLDRQRLDKQRVEGVSNELRWWAYLCVIRTYEDV